MFLRFTFSFVSFYGLFCLFLSKIIQNRPWILRALLFFCLLPYSGWAHAGLLTDGPPL